MSYRSTRVVVQNNTVENLILTGFNTFSGHWDDQPPEGQTVLANGSGDWGILSTSLNTGCGGYLTFICSSGYVVVTWRLPWIGRLEYEVQRPQGMGAVIQIYEDSPSQPVIMVTFWGPEIGDLEMLSLKGQQEIKQLSAAEERPAEERETVAAEPVGRSRKKAPAQP